MLCNIGLIILIINTWRRQEDSLGFGAQKQGLGRRGTKNEEFSANITNASTRRAYKNDTRDFSSFIGIASPEDMRLVTRANVIAWRQLMKKT